MVQVHGIDQPGDGGVGKQLRELDGRGSVSEVLLPAPAHHIKEQYGVVQLL
ncbi:MAG: hypothetical protein MJE68_24280 [Proteobacteria bacterium]|nr:hypothetical protein [Pseudomonadota bacterium]